MNNKTRILILADGFLIMGLCIALANVYATLIMNQPFPFPPIAPIILALIAVVAKHFLDDNMDLDESMSVAFEETKDEVCFGQFS